ncbi:MAG: hypothetical protein MK098_13990 [Marinovum sp.]|nr:hypothetical protein [Marinovum sp.]
MTSFVSYLRDHISKRSAYRRTVEEIRSMPVNIALDLDIYPGDAERIAYRSVYGR